MRGLFTNEKKRDKITEKNTKIIHIKLYALNPTVSVTRTTIPCVFVVVMDL